MKLSGPRLKKIFQRVPGKRILVVGDYMLDRYLWGQVDRISPEAPVPVVNVEKTTLLPGGAANVVQNLLKLGTVPVPVGVIGDDANGECLQSLLQEMGCDTSGLVVDKNRPTTTKSRIMAHNQQVVRADEECLDAVDDATEKRLIALIKRNAKTVDGAIFEDYNKGVITPGLARQGIRTLSAQKAFSSVDPKQENLTAYKGASLLKPNRKEAAQMVGFPLKTREDARKAASQILRQLKLDAVLITLGEQGMVLHEKRNRNTFLESAARKIFDVSGAGDTVISCFTAMRAAGASLREAAFLANQAAGIVVGEVGTATVTLKQLQERIVR